MSDTLIEAITNTIWYEIDGKLHTCIPAIVTKYNSKDVTVEAKPIIPRKYIDDKVLKYRPIVSCPVMFQRTNRFRLSFPIEEGDGVLLVFSERSIEAWLKSGEEVAPSNNTKYSLIDAIAIPGLFAFNKGSKINSNKEMEIVFDKVKITSDGKTIKLGTGGIIPSIAGVVTGENLDPVTGVPFPDHSQLVFAQKL